MRRRDRPADSPEDGTREAALRTRRGNLEGPGRGAGRPKANTDRSEAGCAAPPPRKGGLKKEMGAGPIGADQCAELRTFVRR